MNYIYLIENQINHKKYVGQTIIDIKNRFKKHKSMSAKGCRKLHNAFNKHGRDNFTIELLEETNCNELADQLETFYIRYFDSLRNGYNIRVGGKYSGVFNNRRPNIQIPLKERDFFYINELVKILNYKTRKGVIGLLSHLNIPKHKVGKKWIVYFLELKEKQSDLYKSILMVLYGS